MKRWSPKLAVARSRRNIDGAIERLRTISVEWADVNGSLELEAERLIGELEEFRDRIAREIQEALDAGEHVGI